MRPPLFAVLLLAAVAAPAAARTLDCVEQVGADDLVHLLCEECPTDTPVAGPHRWRIPLWTAAPYPDSDLAGLARAVLCGRSAPCEVHLRNTHSADSARADAARPAGYAR